MADDFIRQILGGLGSVMGGAEQALACCACGRFTKPVDAWVSAMHRRVVCTDCVEALFDEDDEPPWEAARREARPDHWTLLGLDADDATAEDVNMRYRELARDFHPDRHADGDAAMKALNRARAAALEDLK